MGARLGLLQFSEGYFSRIWGGRSLESLYQKPLPAGQPIGEIWLVSDHPQCVSEVLHGPHAGTGLRTLLEGPLCDAIMGSRARLTHHGRFPLLLKLLDAREDLSIQVHPDDEKALAMGEPDVGKTEMWHVLQADPGSSLVCGLQPGVMAEQFEAALAENTVQHLMKRFEAPSGTVVFVPAGTVHALGKGFVIAEIQQNSDLTYRIYDWDRRDDAGKHRELHLDKALAVINFDQSHGGPNMPLSYRIAGATVTVEGACRYFASELLTITGAFFRDTEDASFHILLGVEGTLDVETEFESTSLPPGAALMVPACTRFYALCGPGKCLRFYVPDLYRDIVTPLREGGHADTAIRMLGGTAPDNDISNVLSK